MELKLRDYRYSPKMSVFAPLVVLTVIFVVLISVILLRTDASIAHAHRTLLGGALVYGTAAILLVRYGLSNIDKLEALGLTDSLSLLPNRRALHIDAQRLAATGEETALAMVDLDGFKLVNDYHGHNVGDRLIKECSALLHDICGDEASVYRLGGDEFAVLVSGPIAGNILEGICRTLLTRLTKPFHIDDRAVVVGASIGLARTRDGVILSSSELLRRTDVAMYASKRAGKMRCTWFNEEFDRSSEVTREIDEALRLAIIRNEFHLVYQPLVDANSGSVVAVEALLRWERPDGPSIGPAIFVPIAEDSGLINPIGAWVLRQACMDAAAWSEIKLSVNISAAQLRNPEFPVELGQILEETGFPAARLELEVTETHLVLDSVVASRSLDVIRQFGVMIVLDDFGTGYASIGFLRQFRFEKLKLDRSLVVDAATNGGSRAMMLASIAVARSLDMDVTAEGVETEDQADLVRAAGCDQIQGWLYYRAMTADKLTIHLKQLARKSRRLAAKQVRQNAA